MSPYRLGALLSAGPSGAGKSTFGMGFIERLIRAGYQVCITDPEDDYETCENAIPLGDPEHVPLYDEAALDHTR